MGRKMGVVLTLLRLFLVICTLKSTAENPIPTYRFKVYPVVKCPMTPKEFEIAANRRNCTGHSRYLCAPDKYLSNLIEFCTETRRSLFEKGNCLRLEGTGDLNHYRCVDNFKTGCPTKPYYDEEIYKYRVCLEINVDDKCFVADKHCPERNKDFRNGKKDPKKPSKSHAALVYIFLVILVVAGICLGFYLKRRKENGGKTTQKDGTHSQVGDINETARLLNGTKKDQPQNDEINTKEGEEFPSNGEESETSSVYVDTENSTVIKAETVPTEATTKNEQAIHLTGNTELYKGEKATIIAFIDSKISILSKVCWQKTDSNGYISTIDINEGKYIGSTMTLPSPELHIHFVRSEDEGTYRIVIDTFRTTVYNSIQLKVKNIDCDKKEDSENDNGSKEIGFHEVHHPNIILLHNNTIAMKKDEDICQGICFTNRSLEIGEKVYVRIAETCARWSSSIDFGFTNTDPARNAVPPMHSLIGISAHKIIKCLPIWLAINNVICMSINNDATVSCSINDKLQFTEKLTNVSVNDPIWLVIDLYGNTKAIEISHKKPKIMSCDSFLMEIY